MRSGPGVVFVEIVCVADHQPRQRPGIIVRVLARVRFHALIGLRCAVLQQLLRHGPQIGGGHECTLDMAQLARGRNAFLRDVFCAEEDAAFFVLVEGTFFLDVWPEKPACNDTRSTKRENRKRLSCTDFNYREKPAPMSDTSLSARILINSCVK